MENADEPKNTSYGKRPIWQWILIYAVVGLFIYGLIYYFAMPKSGGGYQSPTTATPQPATSAVPASTNEVTIQNFSFSPATLTIKVGEAVTWTNQDSVEHSATADDGSFDTGSLATGQSGSFTFTTPGTYAYHCGIHPTMKAEIIVK
jgi:plastocyanin